MVSFIPTIFIPTTLIPSTFIPSTFIPSHNPTAIPTTPTVSAKQDEFLRDREGTGKGCLRDYTGFQKDFLVVVSEIKYSV